MSSLPEPGAVYAREVSPGVELLFRVVARVGETCCVVLTKAHGPRRARAPRAEALFQVQRLAHHDRARPLLGGWVSEPAPHVFRPLGRVALRKGEPARVLHPERWVKRAKKTPALARKVLPLTTWDALWDDARAQWRWDHAREALEREEAARVERQADSLEAALARNRAEEEALTAKGLRGLARHRFFAVWRGEKSEALIDAAERAMQQAVGALEGQPAAKAARRLAALVKAFNALQDEHGPFDADDAEDIMEAVLVLAQVSDVTAEDFTRVVTPARAF